MKLGTLTSYIIVKVEHAKDQSLSDLVSVALNGFVDDNNYKTIGRVLAVALSDQQSVEDLLNNGIVAAADDTQGAIR